jgi:hypothetical protein
MSANPGIKTEAEGEPKQEAAGTASKPAFKYNDLIEAFRKLDQNKVAQIVAHDDLSDPAIARAFVQIFRESGCLLLKYPAPSKEKARDELARSCTELLAKCAEPAILDDLRRHIADAQVFEKGFREILASLHNSEAWKRSPADQAWGMIYRSIEEFEALRTRTKTELGQIAAKENAIFDPNQFRLTTKDGHGTDPDAVMDEIIQGLGITLLMLGNLNNWFDAKGTLILPEPTPKDENITFQAGAFTLLAMQWRHLDRAWDRSRLFKAKAELVQKEFEERTGQRHTFTVLQVEEPGIPEAKERVALDRLIQVFGQRQMDLGLSPIQSGLIGGEGATHVSLVPAGYLTLEEYVSADVLANLFHVPVEDPTEKFAGLSLKEWLRGYAYLGKLVRKGPGDPFEYLRFTEKDLTGGLVSAGLSEGQAQQFIGLASLSKTSADPFDTPLIRTQSGALYFFAPAFHSPVIGIILLSRLASINRRRDDDGRMINDCQFEDKGAKFERSVLQEFARAGIPAYGFHYHLNKIEYDCDAAVLLGETLFVFECKNYTLPMGHISSLYYFMLALPGINKQATRIASQLEKNPDIVRRHFGSTAGWKRVVPVVLFALPWATGLGDEAYVYDFSALSRVLRDGAVAVRAVANVGDNQVRRRHLHVLRKGAVPTAEELESDMKCPSQLKLHIAGLKLLTRPSPVSEKTLIAIPEWAHRSLTLEQQLICLGESPRDAAVIANDLEHNFPVAVEQLRQGGASAPVPVRRKVGRNEPCPCGSGLKYKKCCLNKTAGNAKQNTNPANSSERGGESPVEPQQRT